MPSFVEEAIENIKKQEDEGPPDFTPYAGQYGWEPPPAPSASAQPPAAPLSGEVPQTIPLTGPIRDDPDIPESTYEPKAEVASFLDQAREAARKKLQDEIYADVTFPEKLTHTGAMFTLGAMKVAESIPKFHALAQKWVTDLLVDVPEGMDRDVREMTLYKLGHDIDRFMQTYLPIDERQLHTFRSKLASGFGSTGGFLAVGAATAAVSGGATIPALIATGTVGASAESVDIYERAKAGGASEEEALASAAYGIPAGAIEAVPIVRVLGRFNKATGGQMGTGIKNILKQGAAGSVEEAAQEWTQTQIGNEAVRKAGVKEPELMESASESGAIGGIVGFVANTALSAAGVRHFSRKQLLTPEGAAKLVEGAPPVARALAEAEQPTRRSDAVKALKDAAPEAEVEKWSADERKQMADLVREEASHARPIRSDQGPVGEARPIVERGEAARGEDIQRQEEAGRAEAVQGAQEGESLKAQPEEVGVARAVEMPPGEVPPIATIPDASKPSPAPIGDMLDMWFANKDEKVAASSIDTARLQKDIRRITGSRRFGKREQELDQAMHVYIDLKDKPDQIPKYYDQLAPEQQKLVDRSQNLSPAETAIAEEIIELNRKSGEAAVDAEVLANTVDNYTMRLWEPEPGQRKAGLWSKFRTTTARAMPRKLESILHGWALGKELRVKGATNAHDIARSEVAQVAEDRNLIAAATKAGIVGDRPLAEDWKQIEHPNFRKWTWIGSAEEGQTYRKDVFVAPDGQIYQRRPLYAEPELANDLNKILGRSKLYDVPGVKTITKWNAIIKHTILTTSLFHHQAFLRSSMLGSMSANPVGSYQQGRQAIENFTPEMRDLVRGGLTLGRVQDFEEFYLKQKTLVGRAIDKVPMAREAKDKLIELRDRQTDFLFKKLGMYLKAQAGLLEYRALLKEHEADLKAGKTNRHELAKIAANLANDDFGGLHLQRMKRHPMLQHIMRLLLLAPDWTESNVRSMVKAFQSGKEGEVYRAFWARIALKGLGTTVLFNLILSAFDDEPFWVQYKKMWEEGHLRWLDVDVTPLYRALGGDDEKRKYFSLIGHFRDPLKFIVHPVRSAKHKGSVLARIVHDGLTGTDWAGRRFTSLSELMGLDDKGVYRSTGRGHVAGEPKGGKLKGRFVAKDFFGGGPVGYKQTPSFVLYEARQSMPIQMQNALSWLGGEIDGFDALTRGSGIMTATSWPGTSRQSLAEAAKEGDTKRAQAALDRLAREEAEEPKTEESIEKARNDYLGGRVYTLTQETKTRQPEKQAIREEQIADAAKEMAVLGLEYGDLRQLLRREWRDRGYKTDSDALRRRYRRLRQRLQ